MIDMNKYELGTEGKNAINKNQRTAHPISHLPVAYALELHRIIEIDAYYLAENDGFRRSPLDYWLAAEDAELRRV